MPVSKTAKRALRSQKRKEGVNNQIKAKLQIAIRVAKKNPTQKNLRNALSLIDKAAKSRVVHKNKAARIKSALSKLTKKSSNSKVKKTKSAKKK